MKRNLGIAIPKSYENASYSTKIIKKLTFGKQKVILSDEELEKLENIYKYYIDTYGVEIGFINYLLSLREEQA